MNIEEENLENNETDKILEEYQIISSSEIKDNLKDEIHNSANVQLINAFGVTLDIQKQDFKINDNIELDINVIKEKIATDVQPSVLDDVKQTLSATIGSVCEQSIIDEVRATLDNALDQVSKEKLITDNEQIVVHVGAVEDIHRLGIKIPKVIKLKDPVIPTEQKIIQKPSPDIISEVPPPKLAEEHSVLTLPTWMPQPPAQANCPFGLEFLSVIDTVKISQTKIIPGYSRPSFIVSNTIGQYIYEVDVRASCFSNFFCASRRKYEMSILNSNHTEVMHFSRPSERHGRRILEVFAPFDTLIGKINEGRGPLPFFVLMDPTNEVLFRVEAISGPPDSKTYTFGVMPTDGDSLIGKIKQESSGTLKKILRDNFITINYYINLDAKIKALILGASFLIDLIFFEMF